MSVRVTAYAAAEDFFLNRQMRPLCTEAGYSPTIRGREGVMTERELYVDDLAGRIEIRWPSNDPRRVLSLSVETGGGEAEVVLTDAERRTLIELLGEPPR